MRDRILLVSIPKAGTYIMSQVLTELGYSPTHMHIGENAYSQYDPRRLQEGRDHPSRFRIKADWQEALNNIDSHHFAASHLAFDNRKLRAMRGGRVLFLKREPRECVVSYMRWELNTLRRERRPDARWLKGDDRTRVVDFLRDEGSQLSRHWHSIAGWGEAPGVDTVPYERLYSNELERLLGHEGPELHEAIERALAHETLTKSPSATKLTDYWSPEAERVFKDIFGDLDARLGYPAGAMSSWPARSAGR